MCGTCALDKCGCTCLTNKSNVAWLCDFMVQALHTDQEPISEETSPPGEDMDHKRQEESELFTFYGLTQKERGLGRLILQIERLGQRIHIWVKKKHGMENFSGTT